MENRKSTDKHCRLPAVSIPVHRRGVYLKRLYDTVGTDVFPVHKMRPVRVATCLQIEFAGKQPLP